MRAIAHSACLCPATKHPTHPGAPPRICKENVAVLGSLSRFALVSLAVVLSACNVGSGNTSSPGAPQNVVVTAGDGQVVITWDFDSSLQYWIFLSQGAAISLNNYFNNQDA